MQSYKQKIKDTILEGTNAQKQYLFSFTNSDNTERVALKFKLFTQTNFRRYFKGKGASFHDEMLNNLIKSYRGERNINIAFRGSSKTTLTKLFVVFVLLNDIDHHRRYLKVLSRDIKNPKQIVTDVFNLCLEMRPLYGDVFEKDGDIKREETMSSFTMKSGVKFTAGTVGQSQRGHAQDAYRPDWIWFDDIEDRESISSQVITEGIISRIDEAITGLAKGGSWTVTGNYISEYGVMQWFLDKENTIKQITPILRDDKATWDIYSLAEIEIFKKDSEDFFGEYLCLKPDTLIWTEKKLKEIKDIKAGDLVWTHLDRLQKVLKVFENQSDDLIDITIEDKITTITKNHPILVLRDNKQDWIQAGELTLDDLLLIIPRDKLTI
ncbi:MAG: Hint domain-containing protein [Candidatus Roizmanbacteria bacterium]